MNLSSSWPKSPRCSADSQLTVPPRNIPSNSWGTAARSHHGNLGGRHRPQGFAGIVVPTHTERHSGDVKITHRPNSFLQFNTISCNSSLQRKDEWVTLHLYNGNRIELCPKHFARNQNHSRQHLLQIKIRFSFDLHAFKMKKKEKVTKQHRNPHAEIECGRGYRPVQKRGTSQRPHHWISKGTLQILMANPARSGKNR